jgi:hypothetical protein
VPPRIRRAGADCQCRAPGEWLACVIPRWREASRGPE